MTEPATEELLDLTVTVNGVPRHAKAPARRLLSDFLRHDLRLTGTHVGCEHGVCGACTVLVDGQPMRSCLMFAVTAQAHEVTTVEGLRHDRRDGSGAAGVHRVPRAAVRLLHPGLPHDHHRLPRGPPAPHRGGGPRGDLGQPVPLHRLPEHREVGAARRRDQGRARAEGHAAEPAPGTDGAVGDAP